MSITPTNWTNVIFILEHFEDGKVYKIQTKNTLFYLLYERTYEEDIIQGPAYIADEGFVTVGISLKRIINFMEADPNDRIVKLLKVKNIK